MGHKLCFSLLSAAMLMSGCASDKPSPPTEKRVQSAIVSAGNQSQIIVEGWYDLETTFSRPSDTQLRYVTPGDTTKVATLKTFQFIGMMLTGGGNIQGFSKDDLKGHEVMGMINPSLAYMTPRVSEILKEEMQKQPVKKYDTPIVIKPLIWKLTYKNLAGGDDNYQFAMFTTLSRTGKDRDGKSVFQSMECSAHDVNEQEHVLPQWQANSYKKVTDISQSILDECLKKFKAEAKSFLF
ncbi:hypothetical protein [Pantoea agglomerans]|uniref:hypothetical protein n=1 Tax=Enterobacter agglomerans TaxID=549 RepID=UPI003DA0A0EB